MARGGSRQYLVRCAHRAHRAHAASVFGLVAAQYGAYLTMYTDDHRWIKVICAVVMATTTLKAVADSATLWVSMVPAWIAGNVAEVYVLSAEA